MDLQLQLRVVLESEERLFLKTDGPIIRYFFVNKKEVLGRQITHTDIHPIDEEEVLNQVFIVNSPLTAAGIPGDNTQNVDVENGSVFSERAAAPVATSTYAISENNEVAGSESVQAVIDVQKIPAANATKKHREKAKDQSSSSEPEDEPTDLFRTEAEWNNEQTLLLLSIHKEFSEEKKNKYKTKKKYFLKIAEKMKEKGYRFTGKQCQSRFETLERGYKRVQDNHRKTGRKRWTRMNVSEEVKKACAEFFAKKDNVTLNKPLLDHTNVVVNKPLLDNTIPNDNAAEQIAEELEIEALENGETLPSEKHDRSSSGTPTSSKTSNSSGTAKKSKSNLAAELANLTNLQKQTSAEKISQMKEFVKEAKRANDIQEESNKLFAQFLQNLSK